MTVYQGAWTDEKSKADLVSRLAQHIRDVHSIQPWGQALTEALKSCEKPVYWTDIEEICEPTPSPHQDDVPVILTSAAAAPIGASASSRGITARSRTPARDDLPPAALAMIQSMSVQSLMALIHAAQHEISQRATH
jgi:hypothetical protein